MKLKVSKINNNTEGEYVVNFDFDEWSKIINRAKKDLYDNLSIPAFRKGEVPPEIAKKHISEGAILEAAHKIAARKAFDFAVKSDTDIKPYGPPEVVIKKLSPTQYEVGFVFDLRPEIKLGKYTNLNLEPIQPTVTDDEIKAQIDNLKDRVALVRKSQQPLKNGDIAVFDFKGYQNNKPFAGGEAKNFELEIGSHRFIPGFEEQMVGMKPGEKKEIMIKFPEEYPAKNLAGKPVKFDVKLNEIKQKILPANDQEFLNDLNFPNVKTMTQLKEFIKANIVRQKLQQSREKFIIMLLDHIANDSKINIPQSAIKKEALRLKRQFETELENKKMNLKDYEKATGLNYEQIMAELSHDAELRLRNTLILDEIVRLEKFVVTEEEVNEQLKQLAQMYKTDIETLKKQMPNIEYIRQSMGQDKLFKFLYDQNVKSESKPAKKSTQKSNDKPTSKPKPKPSSPKKTNK